ncbi:MAG: hypothetical protein ACOC0K_01725 [bacterium]
MNRNGWRRLPAGRTFTVIKNAIFIGTVLLLLSGTAFGKNIHHVPPGGIAELYVGAPLSGNIPAFTGTPLTRPFFFTRGYRILYLAHVFPGEEYTLGLTFPPALQKLGVALFDRWPYLPGAKRVNLPAGPVVRTNPDQTAFQWRLGISPRSTGYVLYILIEASSLSKRFAALPHSIYLYSPTFQPMNLPGRGITRLQGPRSFFLTDSSMVFDFAEPGTTEKSWDFSHLPIPGDLVQNGRFTEGLDYWEIFSEKESDGRFDTVSLHPGEVGFSSRGHAPAQGIRQRMNVDVAKSRSLILRTDVKVDSQSAPLSENSAPLEILVEYEDVDGAKHAHGIAFSVSGPVRKLPGREFRIIPKGQWFRYMTDLARLTPRPQKIRSLSILGSGLSVRDARIREIHLINREAGQ